MNGRFQFQLDSCSKANKFAKSLKLKRIVSPFAFHFRRLHNWQYFYEKKKKTKPISRQYRQQEVMASK